MILGSKNRRITREVVIGGIALGGGNPIRVQSMTTTDTRDTKSTVKQIINLYEAGSEYVRLTVPTIEDANNLKNIRHELQKNKITTPIIADIHFNPKVALIAADYVEKVRINPGNYADRKRNAIIEYSDTDYNLEIERVFEKFKPLLDKLKQNGCALRIGVNHGSLSDRIMNRFGDTAIGMTESALEFIQMAESENYFDIVLSMKSSIPEVMIESYRYLTTRLKELDKPYPLHLGVTEAGQGQDGRLKSAVGIGTLLLDGIGDTIRVSLTEKPENEIPAAKALLKQTSIFFNNPQKLEDRAFFHTKTKTTFTAKNNLAIIIPNEMPISDLQKNIRNNNFPHNNDYLIHYKDQSPWKISQYNDKQKVWRTRPINLLGEGSLSSDMYLPVLSNSSTQNEWSKIKNLFIPIKNHQDYIHLKNILETNEYPHTNIWVIWIGQETQENLYAFVGSMIGSLLNDKLINGFAISNKGLGIHQTYQFGLDLLQATRKRISKTEYISCPSCGRTLFDLEETSEQIRLHTAHLKGLKIAVMGCIVNGPGEMADADYGYVGAGPGKITLYRGKDPVIRNIDTKEAVARLINLIQSDGLWVEK